MIERSGTAALEVIRADSLRIWAEELGDIESAVLLDFPSHQNAGDSLIYAGEKVYLQRLGIRLRYMADGVYYDPDALRAGYPEGPLLLHGGGNLGDRWTFHQDFRERVIRDFPDRKIIQLPQSLDFTGAERTLQCQRVFGAHPDLTIMVREAPSFEKATMLFPDNKVVYCPDAAFGADLSRIRRSAPEHDVVKILRRDNERVDRTISIEGPVMDWGLSGVDAYRWLAASYPSALARRFPAVSKALYPAIVGGYEAQAGLNIRAAVRRISTGRVLVTDRLHAAVFAGLIGMPVIALDNVYGKVSSIYRDYLHSLDGVYFANSDEEVAALVSENI